MFPLLAFLVLLMEVILFLDQLKTRCRNLPNRFYSCKFLGRNFLLCASLLQRRSIPEFDLLLFLCLQLSITTDMLDWPDTLMGKKWEKVWRLLPCACCEVFGRKGIKELSNLKQSDKWLKSVFSYSSVNWVRVYIEEHSLSMLYFINWLPSS